MVFRHNQIHSTISFISICRKIGCLQGPFLIRRESKLIFPDNTTLKAWNNQLNNLQPLNRHTPCFIFSHKQNTLHNVSRQQGELCTYSLIKWVAFQHKLVQVVHPVSFPPSHLLHTKSLFSTLPYTSAHWFQRCITTQCSILTVYHNKETALSSQFMNNHCPELN